MSAETRSPAYYGQYWDGVLPVEPQLIAERVGVRVVADQQLPEENWPSKYAIEDGIPTIRYSPSEPAVRQRFVIAHEFGHHALGHSSSSPIGSLSRFSSDTVNVREVAANRFAMNLLMPADIVMFKIGDMVKPRLTELADAFGVSEAAMHYRLKGLGILDG